MTAKNQRTDEIISRAESHDGVRAGIVRLEDVLKGLSYKAAPAGTGRALSDALPEDRWPSKTRTVLVLGLNHPESDLRLDYWERGDAWGNRRLREVSGSIKPWLREKYNLDARPLPYHVEKGGVFLKDAAVLSGMGVIGRNNLLLHTEWGPRIRLHAVLLDGEFQTTEPIEGFSPCDACSVYCHDACPVKAFPDHGYSPSLCYKQMDADVENKTPDGDVGENGKRNMVIKYCRACELSCPVGT